MPLRATIDGKDIISSDISDETWEELKVHSKKDSALIILPCCSQQGFLRKSPLGLKHFVHKAGKRTCDWKPESIQHLTAKLQIVQACRDCGWEAIPEYIGNGWIADVLATKGNQQIAFEVQWSKQSAEETKSRQTKYTDNGVNAYWFFKDIPKGLYDNYHYSPSAIKELPLFKIREEFEGKLLVWHNGEEFELSSFVSLLLSGKIKYCNTYKILNADNLDILFYDYQCWKCKKEQHVYSVERNLHSQCNVPIDEYHVGSMWGGNSLEFHPEVLTKVRELLKSPEGKSIILGEIKERHSGMAQSSYVSFGCKYCDAIFGDFYLRQEIHEMKENVAFIFSFLVESMSQETINGAHWCLSETGDFCE